MSCAINLGNSVLISGGAYSEAVSKVSEYNEAGWVRDLPQLLTGRSQHGCSYFVNNKGTKVDIDINYFPLII